MNYSRGGRAPRNSFAAPESTNVAKGPAGLGGPLTLPPSFRCHWLAAGYIRTSLPAACLFRATRGGVHTALFCVSVFGGPRCPPKPPGQLSAGVRGSRTGDGSQRAERGCFRLCALLLRGAGRTWPNSGPRVPAVHRERAEVVLEPGPRVRVRAGLRLGGRGAESRARAPRCDRFGHGTRP